MERSDWQRQPIADTQSRFTVYVTGLLPEPPELKREAAKSTAVSH
jgi:hypothetical protein